MQNSLLRFGRRVSPSLALLLVFSIGAFAQTTAFTYQGRLSDSGTPSSTYDLRFTLYNEMNAPIGTPITLEDVPVVNGAFTAQLDFGDLFPGAERTLLIEVRRGTETGMFTPLSPRQPITSTPYAIRSKNATTADSATNAANATSATNATNATNADTLDNIDSTSFVQTNTTGFIRNQTTQQASSNFNVSGTGTANVFSATTQFNIGSNRVLGVAGTNNLFAGVGAGSVNNGSQNSFFGTNAGQSNAGGNGNSFFGFAAGAANQFGGSNAFFGDNAGRMNTADFNSFFGSSAGFFNVSGNSNSFFGSAAGFNNTASNNSFFGANAGGNNTSGASNSFFGHNAGITNQTGANNSFFGQNAGQNISSGSNSFFGQGAGSNTTSGGSNSFFGQNTGSTNSTGSNITLIGQNANVGGGALTFATAVGSGAVVSTSNTIVLGRTTDRVRLPGITVDNTATQHLCRNTSTGEIVGCTDMTRLVGESKELKKQQAQIKAQQAQIDAQAAQLAEQKAVIDALKKLVCAANPAADVCKLP